MSQAPMYIGESDPNEKSASLPFHRHGLGHVRVSLRGLAAHPAAGGPKLVLYRE